VKEHRTPACATDKQTWLAFATLLVAEISPAVTNISCGSPPDNNGTSDECAPALILTEMLYCPAISNVTCVEKRVLELTIGDTTVASVTRCWNTNDSSVGMDDIGDADVTFKPDLS
jgi:hypothetical protein